MKIADLEKVSVTTTSKINEVQAYAYLIGTPQSTRTYTGTQVTTEALCFTTKGKFLGTATVNMSYATKKVENYLQYKIHVTPEAIQAATTPEEIVDTFNSILTDNHVAFPGTYKKYATQAYFNFQTKNEQGEWVQPIILDDSIYAIIIKAIAKAEAKLNKTKTAEANK